MSWSSTLKAIEAAQRRGEREAQKRLRELERQNKEQAKLSEMEQAKLAVETYENRLEVLLSVHKQQSLVWDWVAVAAALPPPPPARHQHKELKARQRVAVNLQTNKAAAGRCEVKQAIAEDEEDYQKADKNYTADLAQWEKMKGLANRVLRGEHKAFVEALVELSPLAELSDLGSSLHFTVHTATLLACTVKVSGMQAVPAEIKTLTSAGKLSVRDMPKGRFHEIYQDYICGGMLRIAREVFALLPMEKAIVTATVDQLETDSGKNLEKPVLSVIIERSVLNGLDFERLDPSDTIERFKHRGNFRASRKAGMFQAIVPFVPADVSPSSTMDLNPIDLLNEIRRLRGDIIMRTNELPVTETTPKA